MQGSTYFFIREALDGFPPFMLGGLRFTSAAVLMLGWCAVWRGHPPRWPEERCHRWRPAAPGGQWYRGVDRTDRSQQRGGHHDRKCTALVQRTMDRPNWGVNFRSPSTLLGVVAGFVACSSSSAMVGQFSATRSLTRDSRARLVGRLRDRLDQRLLFANAPSCRYTRSDLWRDISPEGSASGDAAFREEVVHGPVAYPRARGLRPLITAPLADRFHSRLQCLRLAAEGCGLPYK